MTDLTGDVEQPAVRRASARSINTRYWLRLSATRLAVLVVTLGLWELASGRLIEPFWVSSPAAIIGRLLSWLPTETFWLHLQVTLVETVAGFIAGTLCGVLLGLVLGMNRYIAEVLDPFIVALYSLPKVALAPLFILWFGIGIFSKIVLVSFGVFFLMFYNTFSGVTSVDRDLVDSLRLMGAKRWQIAKTVIMPATMVWIFTGMKVSVPYALIGAVVGEMLASNRGIGYLVQSSAGQYDTTGVFAALTVLMVISVSIQSFLKYSESVFLHWRE
ncbi:ABC transporter permease [Pseudorhodoplanes sp.]|uniref:ABC transporter permease n=1 Tax=Pseudorhodoplanes sp. TaxID=1934341 RepID=UPI002B835D25|nr:ABC transporter permease [Pseudorhodoplanes sp.]HWV51031.1 ABC transporter permease [Pseudorhodoplanes sp.]